VGLSTNFFDKLTSPSRRQPDCCHTLPFSIRRWTCICQASKPRNRSAPKAATAVGPINSVGSIAGFAGPYIFPYVYTRTGASFSLGLRFVMAAVLIAGLMIL
jgi:hypothetical protein